MVQDVYRAWKMGRACKPGSSIWTNGETVYSYSTAILRHKNLVPVLNVRKYSVTTSRHQNALRELLRDVYNTPVVYTSEPSDLF
jgi:hypothetical protein